MRKLRVGFAGAGFIARFHSKAMESVRRMELTGLLDRTGAAELAARARELDLGPAEIYPSVTELAKHVDAVCLYLPNYARVDAMEELAAAKRGGAPVRAVICDKPLGRNLREARRIASLAEEAGLLTAYFENQIHMRALRTELEQLRPQIDTMGPLTLVRSAEEHGGPHAAWFWNPVLQGGGVLSDMGCHSIAVGWYALTPPGKPFSFLEPVAVSCDIGLLKWGQKPWREKLLKTYGVDYADTPAEDFATGVVTFKNPDTGQLVKAQFTDSWMFEKQGLRLLMDGMGPGYAFEVNTLQSPSTVFVGDAAADAVTDAELALEKATASRGLLALQPNEADLYGYVDENRDAVASFLMGRDAFLPFRFGVEVTKLVMAAYLSAERGEMVDLTDAETLHTLETYVPLVQQGRGAELLF